MKRLALIAGMVLLGAIWFGPLLGAWRESFAAHMVAHMGVIAIAAPLIAIGLPDKWRPARGMPAALPLFASLVELVAVWSWHAPAFREAAETSTMVTIAEQATFFFAGLFLWSTSIGVAGQRAHAASGAAALLLTSIHMTLLGALLSLSQRPLFGAGQVTCFGVVLDGGEDQQIGGIVMLMIGAIVYLAGGLYLVAQVLSDVPARLGKAVRSKAEAPRRVM